MTRVAPPEDIGQRPHRHALRRRAVRSALQFLLACVVAYLLEHYAEHLIVGGSGNATLTQSVFNVRDLYQYAVAAWPRRLVPRYTVLVHVDPATDPTAAGLAHNICEQRSYLARLVPAIAEREPAIIVIDKYFTEGGCSQDAPTAALRQAIADVSARLPVVVGLRIDERAAAAENGVHRAPPIVAPLQFAPTPWLREGVVNLDLDSRRIALGWTVQRKPDAAPEWRNGIALEAAQAYDPKLQTKYPRLARMVEHRSNPYLSMIPISALVAFQGADVLCASAGTATEFRLPCASRIAPPVTDPSYLRGRIVIVGEASRDLDRHLTVIGDVQGSVLQTNYVEAILDERYFSPAPVWVDYLIGFLFFVAIEACLLYPSAWGAIGRVAGVIGITFLLLVLTVRHLGYYLNPVTVSLLILVIKLIVWLNERINHAGESHHEA